MYATWDRNNLGADGWPQRYNPVDYKDVPQCDLVLTSYLYPCWGYCRTFRELRRQWPRIIETPIEEQAEHADATTRRHALNKHFPEISGFHVCCLDENAARYVFDYANVTAVANMAFVALANDHASIEYALHAELIMQLHELLRQNIPKSPATISNHVAASHYHHCPCHPLDGLLAQGADDRRRILDTVEPAIAVFAVQIPAHYGTDSIR